MSTEDIIDGLAIIQQKRGRIVERGDVEMLALAIKELRKGRAGEVPTGQYVPPACNAKLTDDELERMTKNVLGPIEVVDSLNAEDAARYRWFRDECGYDRCLEIIEVSEAVPDMLDHHIDKGRCGL